MPKTVSEDQEHIEKAAWFPSGEVKWNIVCPSLLPYTSCKWPLESSWQIINNLPDVPFCRTFVLIWLSAVIPCEKTWCEPLWVYPKHTLQGPDCCSSVSMIPMEGNRQNSKPVVMKWNSFHFIKRENRSDLSAGLDVFLRSLPTGLILWFHNKKQVHIFFIFLCSIRSQSSMTTWKITDNLGRWLHSPLWALCTSLSSHSWPKEKNWPKMKSCWQLCLHGASEAFAALTP